MEKRKEYRSAVRSRRLICIAFLELLRQKPYEKITVTDIVSQADINRSTFYAHYPDVRGLVEEIIGEVIDHSPTLASQQNIKDFVQDPVPFLQELTSYSIEHRELYALLSRSDFAQRQMDQLRLTLIDSAVNTLSFPDHVRNSMEFRIQLSIFIGGILTVYMMWLRGELDCSLDDITAQLAVLIRSSAEVFSKWF